MSRVTKWKLEKTKLKVVFRLQFHATHIPQSGWDKLFISFIPADSGKATAKTTKANVRNGTCKWADPIYETTRLLQDAKTKHYDEKLYKLVVSMGSSRASILGEAMINLADYADALKPSVAVLPLHGCSTGTTLHVTVQLLTSKTGFREFEQQRETREKGLQTGDKHDESSLAKSDNTTENVDKIGARIRSRSDARELSSVEEETGNEESGDLAVGFDGSSNTSGSLYAEKIDSSSAHEIDSLKSTFSGDTNGGLQYQNPQMQKVDPSDSHNIVGLGIRDSVQGWCSAYPMNNDLAMAYDENNRLRGNLDFTELSIFDLKLELSSLQSQADEIGIQTQKFSHVLATEISSYQDLSSEVAFLKSECYKYKDEIERLRNLKVSHQIANSGHFRHHHLLQDIQVQWMKGIVVVEDMTRELQSKVYLGLHERDSPFLHAEFEALLNTLQDLKRGTGEAISLFNVVSAEKTDLKEIRETSPHRVDQFGSGTGLELEVCEPEILLRNFSIPPLVSQETDSIGTIDTMKKHIVDLVRELDGAKTEKESLTRKMGQMECYYEALIQELEENQKQMLIELQNIRNEHSTCFYTLSTNKAEMESMRQDMNEQILRLADERHDLDALNKELERRATTSEAALRRARLNYSIAVGKLQNDLELLSSQVVSMFETNENLIKQAFSETSQPPFLGYMDQMHNLELSDATRVQQSMNQNVGPRKQQGGDVLRLEDLKRSLSLQEDLYRKVEEELVEMHCANLQLDIFSRTLKEALSEAISDMKLLRIGMDELGENLSVSNTSKDLLMGKLQDAIDDIHILSEYKISCTAENNDLAMQNEFLKSKLENISVENSLLLEKVADWEAITMECRNYESRYELCLAEKNELSVLLEQEASVSSKLQNENSLLNQELATTKGELSELKSLKENLEGTVSFVEEKLGNLLAFCDETLTGLSLSHERQVPLAKTKSCKDVVLLFEEIQHTSCSKILQLMEENSSLEKERQNAVMSLSATKSEFLAVKQMFKNNIQDMVFKLDVSNAVVENLQVKFETFSNRMLSSSEAEEKFIEQQRELLADLDFLEHELHNLMSKDGHLVQGILSMEDLAAECGRSSSYERSTSTISALIREKQELVITLQDKTVESAKLASEVSLLKEDLGSVNNELNAERDLKSKLASKVGDLTHQLNREQDKLLEFTELKAELDSLKQLVADLELENSRLSHLLFQCEKKLHEQSSCMNGIENDLSDMHESLISADVTVVFLISMHKSRMEELGQRVRSSDHGFSELLRKYHDLEKLLQVSLVKESCFTKEKMHFAEINESLRSDLEASATHNRFLSNENSAIRAQLEEYRMKLKNLEAKMSKDKEQYTLELEYLEDKLKNAEEETLSLICAKEQLEITVLVLKDKLDEQFSCVSVLEACQHELTKMCAANSELSDKLSQHVLKSEEVRNISMLNEKAFNVCDLKVGTPEDKDQRAFEMEHLRSKLENAEEEANNLTLNDIQLDILTIFLRNKLDEQLTCARLIEERESELMALRAANDELSDKLTKQALKTEELKNLSIRLKELKDKAEAECVISKENREAQEPPVALQESLRMAFIKEQYETKIQELKQQVAISKRHGEEMLMKLQDAVDEIENRKRSEALYSKKNEELALKLLALDDELQSVLSDSREKAKACDRMKAELECALLSFECCKEEKEKLQIALQQSEKENSRISAELVLTKQQAEGVGSLEIASEEELISMKRVDLLHNDHSRDSFPNPACHENLLYQEAEDLNLALNTRTIQDDSVEKDVCATPEHAVPEAVSPPEHVEQNSYLLHTASLRSSINHLHEELERMKKENSLFPDDVHFDSDCHDLQNELMRLEKANAELRSIFPLYNEISTGGNALERVLALEIELAEALRAKHKSQLNFQSSFIKQHSDEEAILKSFRDINELIKELLEVKGRYAAVEAELKDMHDRYSDLSLKFAEVEGDRQKIKMTLKNVRASRKVLHLNRSSSTTSADVSS
ncbi:OLC1v1017497C1 [Oldenlandia corymbosa var. corymbosa]|uniref:OLC1v1017497C1 n=1 Tax=Oldenlandia corymbosa var. corymbosa TaxID=529605 RepID=A0AAV1E9M7_OLDCO|nr:OLC1v1017497C1 [Oldenlandia corymbosa var. corymbosa]